MDPQGPRLISPYRAPTIAERKKWLFMTQERRRLPRTFSVRYSTLAALAYNDKQFLRGDWACITVRSRVLGA
jgi:hypothetical protein